MLEFRVIRLTESSSKRHDPLPPWFGQIIADGPEPFQAVAIRVSFHLLGGGTFRVTGCFAGGEAFEIRTRVDPAQNAFSVTGVEVRERS